VVGRDYRNVASLQGPLIEKAEQSIRKGEFFQNLEVKLKRSGKDVLTSCDLAPLIDRDGDTIGYMLFLADVTELRKLEAQIKLKEKLAAIGELSAGIAHEIRNPLNSIELFLGLLQRKLKGEEDQIQLVGKVRTEIQKLNDILSNFLKFARPLPLNLTNADLRKVIQDSLFFAQAEIDERKIDVTWKIPEEPMDSRIDPQQIQQAFTNIILNAAQAMEEDGRLSIVGGEGLNGFWTVGFSDTGPGIPPENLARIFNPFFTTKDQGTGLGLAMVHKIVETHGGDIEVISNRSGTTFTIHLPKSMN
jgi:two-component system sensor histidine kinase HydH